MKFLALFPSHLQRVSAVLSLQLVFLSIVYRSPIQETLALSPVSNVPKSQQSQRPTTFPNSVPAGPSDVETSIRQTGQVNPSRAAIGIPSTCACQHGFPQAFSLDPFHAGRMNSGLLKLTCPHLVRAVDALEDRRMIHDVNQLILEESVNVAHDGKKTLNSAMTDAHERHATARKKMLTQQELDQIQSKLGEQGMKSFIDSGVAGATIGSQDSKCLHAWLADALFFGPTPLGDIIREELEKQNVDISGTPTCRMNCDPNCSPSMANPPKARNKQRLRSIKETERKKRRKIERQE
jgi:hypothetical protein